MLYPDFNELVAFKNQKSTLRSLSYRSLKSIIPGSCPSPFRGQGLEFDFVREYVPGDDIRNIDWRVTARTGSPHLKLFKEEHERHIVICVDMNAHMRFGTRNTFKSIQAAYAAAFIGWQGIAQQDRVSACLFGDVPNGIQFFPPKRTQRSLCHLLKMIAEPSTEQHCISMETALQYIYQTVQPGSLVYLLSDFMNINQDFQQKTRLNGLRKKCDIIFIAINDRADKSLYPAGMIKFCANKTEKIHINTNSLTVRESYAAQWKENRQQLHVITSSLMIPLIELTTESTIRQDLMLGLKGIAKRKKR